MQSRNVFFPFQPPLQPKVSKKKGKTTRQHEPLEVLNYTVYAMESTFLLKTFLTSIITSYQLLSRSASSCYTGIYSYCPTELLPCFLGFNIVIISWSFTVWLENTLQGLFSFGKAKWKANFLSPYMSENVSFIPIFNYSCSWYSRHYYVSQCLSGPTFVLLITGSALVQVFSSSWVHTG